MQKYEAIEKGILENDLEALRESVGSICYTCRNFKNGEFDEVVEYVISRGIPLIDPELKGELVSSGKESFTDGDFARAVFELKENFCNERIADVKTIGAALYPNDHEAAEDGNADGADHSDAADANGDAEEAEGEYRSKYDNGKSNPIKSILRAVCDFFSAKEDSAKTDEGGNLFQTIVKDFDGKDPDNDGKFDTPADVSAYDGSSSAAKNQTKKERSSDAYFDTYRVSEDEMKRGSSSQGKKLDTDAPEADETADDRSEKANAETNNEEGAKDGFDLKKIDPLYIAAAAVGVAVITLIIIAFLK